MIIAGFLYALVGWLAGVGINQAADMLPQQQSLRRPPACPVCQTPWPAPAWSALIAYAAGYTRCTHCGARRDRLARAMLVELLTPVMFAFLLGRYGLSWQLVLVSIYTAVLILITITDLEHRLIFHRVMLPAILFAVVAAFFTPDLSWKLSLVGGAAGFVLSYIAALFARGGLGGGDVTLSAFLGLIVGFPYILLNLLFGVFLGGFVALLLLVTRRVGMKTFIPYGPFLTITGWMMLVWRTEIWNYYF